jgi:hypothetical protein
VASTVSRPSAGYSDRVGFGIVNAERALTEAGKLAGYKNRGGLPGTRPMGGPEAGPVEVVDRDPLRIGGFGGAAILAVLGGIASLIVMRSLSRRMRRPAAPGAYPAPTGPAATGAGPPGGLPPALPAGPTVDPYARPGPLDTRPM